MVKRELKRIQSKFGKLLDPLGLFILLSLFILPALTIVNLSPKAGRSVTVLGTESKPGVGVVLVGGVHDYIKDERISFPQDDIYTYNAQIIKHGTGRYSKPILQLTNFSDKDETLILSGNTQTPTGSEIFLAIDEREYMIQNMSGDMITEQAKIKGSTKPIVYLVIKTSTPLQFNEDIEVNIVKK